MSVINSARSRSYVGQLILGGTLVSGAIALVIIVAVAILAIEGKRVPDVLANWGGVILGFYFGQFMSLVKDYMAAESRTYASRPQSK
jgi:hypothetical protein